MGLNKKIVSVEHDFLFFKPDYDKQEIGSVESKFENSRFEDILQTDECRFNITMLPNDQGVVLRMKGVKVIPVTHTHFSYIPRWLEKICLMLGAKKNFRRR